MCGGHSIKKSTIGRFPGKALNLTQQMAKTKYNADGTKCQYEHILTSF